MANQSNQAIDWQGFAAFAGAILRWPPHHFWHATPAEFYTALAGWQRHVLGIDPNAVADGGDLARLTALFPDT